ncbi:hypothetical protein HDU97_006773 [Phlyctochytrium planicorne]|nr:hypothetical protein HDU97_006773 [Phlyctochytrium planicorne]
MTQDELPRSIESTSSAFLNFTTKLQSLLTPPSAFTDLCAKTFKVDGYPTTQLFINGSIQEEYKGEDDVEPTMSYLESKKSEASKPEESKTNILGNAAKGGLDGSAPAAPSPAAAPVEKSHEKSQSEASEDSGSDGKKKAVVGGSVGGAVLLCGFIAVALVGYRYYSKKSKNGAPEKYSSINTF